MLIKEFAVTCLLSLATCAQGFSSGASAECNPMANFGCAPEFRKLNPWKCDDPEQGIMPWALKPVKTSAFTLRTEDTALSLRSRDAATYLPKKLMKLHVRVHQHDMKYRGIILVAQNSAGEAVGEWFYPPSDSPWFWSSASCPSALVHYHGNEKPYHSTLSFVPPEPGTGRITFKMLIKTGVANSGSFWYPMEDLTLDEELDSQSMKNDGWRLASLGQTCSDRCSAEGLSCNGNPMLSNDGDQLYKELSQKNAVKCAPRLLGDCTAKAPSYLDGTCYYHNAECVSSGQETVSPVTASATCSQALFGPAGLKGQRICYCGEYEGVKPPVLSDSMRVGSGIVSWLLSSVLLPTFTAWNLSSSFCWLRLSPRLLGVAFTLSLFMVNLPGAVAHNWGVSPQRNRNIARASSVCDPRKETDTHAQIGAGQDFPFQWAVGHDRESILVVLHEKDEHMMKHPDYRSMVLDYLAKAPANKADQDNGKWTRFRGGDKSSDARFGEVMRDGHPNWLSMAKGPSDLTLYKPADVSEDQHASYESDLYPWIEAAHKYEHIFGDAAGWDGVRVQIPGRGCPGSETSCHYVLHWIWAGYSDCTDIDYFPNTFIDNVFGVESELGHTYARVDHCQYIEPSQYLSQCLVVDTPLGANACKDLMENQSPTFATNAAPYRFGIMTIPINAPPTVAFPEVAEPPYQKGWCAAKEDMRLQSSTKDKVNQVDWAKFEAMSTISVGHACSEELWTQEMEFREAIIECTTDFHSFMGHYNKAQPDANGQFLDAPQPCMGLSASADSIEQLQTGMHTFTACKTLSVDPSQGHVAVLKDPAQMPPMKVDIAANEIKVSFQDTPDNLVWHDNTDASEFLQETGQKYPTQQGSHVFGYNCPEKLIRAKADASKTGRAKNENWVTSVDSTYHSWDTEARCPDGSWPVWEIDVPNGIYQVHTFHEAGNHYVPYFGLYQLTVEGIRYPRLQGSVSFGSVTWTQSGISGQHVLLHTIEVTDGKLTLSTDSNKIPDSSTASSSHKKESQFPYINYITFRRVGVEGTKTPAWLPGATDAFFQREFDNAQTQVGLVKITTPNVWYEEYGRGAMDRCKFQTNHGRCADYTQWRGNDYDCRDGWLITGDRCGAMGVETTKSEYELVSGPFEGPNSGAIVRVTDKPCTATSCQPETDPSTVCAVVRQAPNCDSRRLNLDPNQATPSDIKSTRRLNVQCPLEIDCQGKIGKYLRIELPGEHRIFAAKVEAYAPKPTKQPLGPSSLACIAVKPRPETSTEPEFVVTDDPEDPIFYSTCFVRNKVIEWANTGREQAKPEPRFQFHDWCLDCNNFQDMLFADDGQLHARNWSVGKACQDCNMRLHN